MLEVQEKNDGSAVCRADLLAESVLSSALQKLTPDREIISEESAPAHSSSHSYWLVDPLDGTASFIKYKKTFAINIAYLENRCPVFGIIAAPALDLICVGYTGKQTGAWFGAVESPLYPLPEHQSVTSALMITQNLNDQRLEQHQAIVESCLDHLPFSCHPDWLNQSAMMLNSAIKYICLARRQALVMPRLAPTMEWDTAAGDAILRALGGQILCLDKRAPLAYHKPAFRNPALIAFRP